MIKKPKVSISCITYNHANFISQCLDGFLMQKTDFPFEVLIHDDASTDGTTEIVKEYEKKYPDIIKPIYENANQFSKGVSISKTFNFSRVQGEYVAICEGDDYWTDPLKLQKQVDFLDKNPDYSICFTSVQRTIIKDVLGTNEDLKNIIPHDFQLNNINFKGLLNENFIPTTSVMYRWDNDFVNHFPNGIIQGDWYCHLYFVKQGKIHFIKDVTAIYRVNSGGIWSQSYQDLEKFYLKIGLRFSKFFIHIHKEITDYSKKYYEEKVISEFLKCHQIFVKYHAWDKLYNLYQGHPKIFLDVMVQVLKIWIYEIKNCLHNYEIKARKNRKAVVRLIKFILIINEEACYFKPCHKSLYI